ncbi:MAG: serine/threonine protein kinase [Verrucomicrobia bacterium]|nr:serine/threonine protein kinase [Verrucomicrobiota bacterium]
MSSSLARQEALFHAALDLAKTARAGFLARECGDDPVLRARIERLLAAHEKSADTLEPPLSISAAESAPLPASIEVPGTRIGRYTLVEKIGEGGCGSVWLAEQDDFGRRRVALKLVKLGMDTADVIARFEAERQALARMDHPHIAKVFDAGATGTGRPYFVMELVRGIRLTDYCDQQACPLAERLRLFIDVCHAVQHAHQKGVIHRDLKPSNILVALHDGTAVPQVIDFGIAKATHGRLGGEARATAFDQFVGTPAYVSPEQADASERDIDTRSDVYSLGVLLYELTTGGTPFAAETLAQAGLGEMRRLICEVDPPRASQRLEQLEPARLAAIATARRTTSRQLLAAVRGDLDWITLRGLEKNRSRRYQTAASLAADVQRHLRHEPVEASPPRAAYLLGKLVRRHRAMFAAAAIVALALLGTAIVSLRLALAARTAERRAESEATAANQMVEFLQRDLLAPDTPEQTPVWDLRWRTMLDRADASLEGRFAGKPLAEATLRETLAASYRALGDHPAEVTQLARAFALRRQAGPPDQPPSFETQSRLAAALDATGRFVDAERHARTALAAQRRLAGPERPETLRTMQVLASILWNQGRLREAAALHKQTFDLRERVLGRDHPETLASMQELAQAYRGYGELISAQHWGRRVLEAKTRVLGPEHPATIIALNGLGMTQRALGQLDDAESLHRRALDLRRRLLGPEHPDTLISQTNLAFVFQDQARYEEAGRLDRETLEVKRRTLGSDHASTLNSLSILAIITLAQGRAAEAVALHESVLATRRRTLGPEHPETINSLHLLAIALRENDRIGDATSLFAEALALRRRVLGPQHPDTLRTQEEFGRARLLAGEFAAALELLTDVLAAREQPSPRAWRTAAVRSEVGAALAGLQRFELAERHLHAAHHGLLHADDPIPPAQAAIVRITATRLAQLYRQWNKPAQAERWERLATTEPTAAR